MRKKNYPLQNPSQKIMFCSSADFSANVPIDDFLSHPSLFYSISIRENTATVDWLSNDAPIDRAR